MHKVMPSTMFNNEQNFRSYVSFIDSDHADRKNMKRKIDAYDELYIPKKAHYEDKMSDEFDGISIDDCDQSSTGVCSPVIIEQLSDEDYTELPTSSASSEPFVEEPDASSTIMLSEELQDYIQLMRREPLLPKKKIKGNELVLYGSSDDIRNRITEITDEDEDLESVEETVPVCSNNNEDAQCCEYEPMDID